MEASDADHAKENGSQKLLYRYQYAFLNMQKHFTCLLKILKGNHHQALLICFKKWISRTEFPYSLLLNNIYLLKSSVSLIEFKFKLIFKARLSKWLHQIISRSNLKRQQVILVERNANEKDIALDELKTMESEVKRLRINQAELEILSSYYGKSESSTRQKSVQASHREQIKKTKAENIELERQITELNGRIVGLFEDLNLALDNYENAKKSKCKKGKRKVSLAVRKNILPINN